MLFHFFLKVWNIEESKWKCKEGLGAVSDYKTMLFAIMSHHPVLYEKVTLSIILAL